MISRRPEARLNRGRIQAGSGAASTGPSLLFLGTAGGHSQEAGPIETPSPNTWPDSRVKEWTQFASNFSLAPAPTQLIGNVTSGLDLSMWSQLADTYPTAAFGFAKDTRTGSRFVDWNPTPNGGSGVLEELIGLANTAKTTMTGLYPSAPVIPISQWAFGEQDALSGTTQANCEIFLRQIEDFVCRNWDARAQFIFRQINNTFSSVYAGTAAVQAALTAVTSTEYRNYLQDGGDAASMVPWDWILSSNPHFSFEPRLDSSDGVTMRQGLRLIGQHTANLVLNTAPTIVAATQSTPIADIVTTVTVKDYWESVSGAGANTWTATVGGHNFTEATNPPTLTTDAGINNQNYYSFDGVNDQFTASGVDLANGDCVLALVRFVNPAVTNQSLWGGSAAGAPHTAYIQTAGSLRAFSASNGAQQAIPTNTWVVVFVSYRNSTRDFMRCASKATARAYGTACGATVGTGWKLGVRATSTGFGNVHVAAVARFAGEPPPWEIAGVINKWQATYGTSFTI